MEIIEQYKALCTKVYKELKKINYGVSYFNNNAAADAETKNKYSKLINSFKSSFKEFSNFADVNNLPDSVSLEFVGPGFLLKNGYLYGNVESAKSYASRLLKDSVSHSIDFLQKFAQAVYISACTENCEKIYIDVPQEYKNLLNESRVVIEASAQDSMSFSTPASSSEDLFGFFKSFARAR